MRRAVLTLIAVGVFSLYVLSNQMMVGRPAPFLATSLDRAIPFWPPAMFVYLSVYLFLFLPVVQVKEMHVFTRVAYAFYTYNLLGMAIFQIYPVRMDRPLDFALDSVWTWGVAFNYAYDPPYNSFPSLHVANAVFAGCVAQRLDRPVGIGAMILTGLITISTLLVKQHWIADLVTGWALGYAAYKLFVDRAVPPGVAREYLVFPRRNISILVGIYLTVFFALVASYYLGWQPFRWPPTN